jgi:hypothetical protein
MSYCSVGRWFHGTTLATNALIERRGAKTALITTEGFRDVLVKLSERRSKRTPTSSRWGRLREHRGRAAAFVRQRRHADPRSATARSRCQGFTSGQPPSLRGRKDSAAGVVARSL